MSSSASHSRDDEDRSEELRRVNEIRRDFVANVSHELKTPATSLALLAESLEDSLNEDSEQARVFASQLRRETERLSKLINDLLDLARLESADPGESQEEVDVRSILMTVLARMRRVAKEKDIALQWRRFGRADSYTVLGNETQLVSMFTNLIENAVKYTSTGGEVEVIGGYDEKEVSVSISDTGIGIAGENLPRIFERFYRVDKARSKATGGTGLGLSIVRHIINNHGGRIEVSSEVDTGTTFTVYLPKVVSQ